MGLVWKEGGVCSWQYVFFKTENLEEIHVEIHDVFSNGDCTQNWYFTVSGFEATLKNFRSQH